MTGRSTGSDPTRPAVRVLTCAAGLSIGVAVAMTLLPRLTVATDVVAMAGSFAPYALVPAASGVAGLTVAARTRARSRRGPDMLLQLVSSALILSVLVALALPRFRADDRPAAGVGFTLAAVNLRLGEADPDGLARAVAGADVAVLSEITRPVAARLDRNGFAERLPYALEVALPRRGAGGTMVYSRFPLGPARPLMADAVHQNWVTTVEMPQLGPVTLVAVHPRRPYARQNTWLGEQRALRAALPRDPLTVVAGDFNAVPEHATMLDLADDGFTSATDITGDGQLRTFNARGILPPLIRIDHILVSERLTATAVTTLAVKGSDHLGLQAVIAGRR